MKQINPIETSKITPELINQYRQLLSLRQDEIDWLHDTDWRQADAHFGNYLMAFKTVQPFIIRFEQEPRPYGRSPVAYLAAALAVGVCIGYQKGFNAYYDAYIEGLWADIYYADNPIDCPPCDEGEEYEWFYGEPPLDNHQPRETELPPAKQEGGTDMDP